MDIADNTPIIIGIGQVSEPVPTDLSSASSHVDLAGKAASSALQDAKGVELAAHIDVIVAVKIFADSSPFHQLKTGRTNNFPRSIGNRIGANPKEAIYSAMGGDTPQRLINECAEKLAEGNCEMVLIAGAEALANAKAAQKQKVRLDWSEKVDGQLEDRGMSSERLSTATAVTHQVLMPMQYYGLMENARRGAQNKDLTTYSHEMGEEFSKLSQVAANNPYSAFPTAYDADYLATPSKENPLMVAPYTKGLIAKDRVNQGAAVLLTTVIKAKELGIDKSKWVYLHGYAATTDTVLLERPQLGQSKAMEQALLGAMENAGTTSEAIQHYDIYSCFPIVVSEARHILRIAKDDLRPLTQTGGLPYFGGPGSNYTMHGIASLVETLRKDRDSFGMAYANGGWMSKHAVGIYSTTPTKGDWTAQDSKTYQAKVDQQPIMTINSKPEGVAILETYTVHYFKGFPVKAIIIGRLKSNNQRFYATTPMEDTELIQTLAKGDSIGKTIYVETDPKGNRFSFEQEGLARYRPKVIDTFQDNYKFCVVEKQGWILKVTINRPAFRNALHPPANDELDGVFNAFERDKSLRVAIITGTGTESFSAGNDLKYMASGNPVWVPKGGFAGLTHRTNRVKPIIAAVNGFALGGGLEIALACDMVVAADHALLGLPEVTVGLYAGGGGVERLSRQIGIKPAMEMLLTGQPINCEKALALGLINYAVPSNQLLQKTEEIATLICQASPDAIGSTMQLLHETATYDSSDEAVTAPHNILDNLVNSADFWEGSKAFAEKRKPNWTLQQV